MTGFDWEAYNEGCQKVISAIQYAKFTELGDHTVQMAEISYPVDANGTEDRSLLDQEVINHARDSKWWSEYLEQQDYRV